MKKHQIINVDVSELKELERNARLHSADQLKQITESIKRFGFLSPVVIDSNNVVVAGNGRLIAAKGLGIDSVPAIRAQGLSQEELRAYALVDNRLSETSSWDIDMLKIELDDLIGNGMELDVIGFSDDEISKLVSGPFDFVPDFGSDSDSQPKKAKLVVEFATLEDMDELLSELKSRGFKVKVG
jgi:ParB-like chromosome segregation protein Spo0J